MADRRKPQDSEIDVYGLTHVGKLRKENQDHFLIASLNRQMLVHQTSLPDDAALAREPERMAFVAMVADGVGSGAGEEASRFAVQAISQYIMRTVRTSYAAYASDPNAFARELEEAALQCHAGVLERASQDEDRRHMATTLTLWIGLWPTSYLLQVGDSRCYIFWDGALTQVSRDQTMAQALVDQGVLTQTRAHSTRWAHVLASAIGGSQAAPVVTQFEQRWGLIGLLCSDGLTKHVPDDRIAERLATMTSAQQVCEALLQDALDGGGSDNITVVAGRTIKRD
ncbi:MAG TPA: protein phosphatase 2C domain-containing protein [Gemmatimonadales bacterium]